MCIHIDGRLVLSLRDSLACKALHRASCGSQSFPFNYSIGSGGRLARADCGCDMENFWGTTMQAKFPDLPAAEAEFRKREAALLGREAE